MDIETYLENAIKAKRAEQLDNSDVLTLGEMIAKIETVVIDYPDAEVKYDFGYMFPTTIDSWRGVYAELALNYVNYESAEQNKLSANEFLELLKSAVGRTFYGYKGGEFKMSAKTPVWVDNYGEYSSTGVIDIINDSYQVIIVTAYREL